MLALTVAVLVTVALTVAACTRTVTHEPDTVRYDRFEPTTPTTNAAFDDQHAGGPAAYEGTRKARSFVKGGSGEHAWGEIKVDIPSTHGGGFYGAGLYLPPGTIAGPNPKVSGDVNLMGWTKGSEFGGIRLSSSDRKARLVGAGNQIGPAFTLREGCWNWLVVHQKLHSNAAEAINEVFLNGDQVVGGSASQSVNSSGNGAYRVEFGLGSVSTSSSDLEMYIDKAYVSTSERIAPQGNECKPLPNVLFIVTDDQRADTVVGNAASNPVAEFAMPKTRDWFRDGDPSIADGTEFPNGFATTPWCCPARASIFTGQYAHNTGVRTLNAAELPVYAPKLQYSVQRYLKDWWGYRTAMFGKFLNHWTISYDPRYPDTMPPETYFDEYQMYNAGYRSGGVTFPRECAGRQSQPPVNQNTSSTCIFKKDESGVSAVEQGMYTTHYWADEAKKFIERREAGDDRQPWFMYVAPWAPHEEGARRNTGAWSKMTDGSNYYPTHPRGPIPAFTPTPAHHEGPDRIGKPPWVRGNGGPTDGYGEDRTIFEKTIGGTTYPGLREQQIRALGDVDDMVDLIFDTLVAKGEADNTIAFFISDNGYMWREHSPSTSGTPNECYSNIYTTDPTVLPPSNTKIACGISSKAKPYRESIQVPLFMRWPAGPAMPLVDSRLTANVDLAPTVLDAVGGLDLLSQPMDGRSLLRSGQRDKILTEGFNQPQGVNNWASMVEPNGDQYIFLDSDADPDSDDPTWEELYTLLGTDGQKTNRYGSDGVPNGTEPPRRWSATDLTNWRNCAGSAHQTPPAGKVACP
jgi:arylsulfatase A-like enzyme